MRFVERLHIKPTHCLAIPFLGANHPKGYVDFGVELTGFDNHVAISVEALQQAAKDVPQLNLVSRDELTVAHAELEAARAENEDLRAQMAEYDRELDAISVLKAKGYQPIHRVGRKPAAK